METIAKHRHARSSAQKVRLVADLIRGKKVSPTPTRKRLYWSRKFWNLPLLTLNTTMALTLTI